MAKTYLALDKSKKSKKLYEKLLKKNELNEDLLAEVIKAVAPTDEIYPMHTEHPEMFRMLDIGEFAEKIVDI